MKANISKKYVSWIIFGGLCAFFASGLILYMLNSQFKEDIDDIYSSVYFNFFVDPTMSAVADKQVNISYCQTASHFQKLDVYTPKGVDTPRPVVMYIHGGGWSTGDKANPFVVDYGAEIIKTGMAFISVNYRLAPAFTYPAQNQDVECALAYIKNHASELNVDATKIGLLGDSAGGQLAAMLALTSPDKSLVRAVVEFYSPSDIWAQITRKPQADRWAINYIGSATNEVLARQASPLSADLRGAPPFLLLHGTNDQTVHFDQAVNFAAKLKQSGVDVTLTSVERANHYFGPQSKPTHNSIESQTAIFFQHYLLKE